MVTPTLLPAPVDLARYEITVLTPDYKAGRTFRAFTSADLVLRFNNVDSFNVVVPAADPAFDVLTDKGGIEIRRDGIPILTGPIAKTKREWDGKRDYATLTGFSDDVWLLRRVAYPDPAGPEYWDTTSHDVRSGIAETVMKSLVAYQAGTLALPERRILTQATDLGRGVPITIRARFGDLLSYLRKAGALAGLGFKVIDRKFEVYEVADKTASIIFSPELRNLQSYSYTNEVPSANWFVGAGTGEGTDRLFSILEDTASQEQYGRYEYFYSRTNVDDLEELEEGLQVKLDSGKDRTNLVVQPYDIAPTRFRQDYEVGDKVSVIVDDYEIQDVVREVQLVLRSNQAEQIKPVVGTPGQGIDLPNKEIFESLRDLNERLRQIEEV